MYFAIDDILVASTGEASVNMVEADNLILTEYYTPEGIRIEKARERYQYRRDPQN